jgi:hypothetical protein
MKNEKQIVTKKFTIKGTDVCKPMTKNKLLLYLHPSKWLVYDFETKKKAYSELVRFHTLLSLIKS